MEISSKHKDSHAAHHHTQAHSLLPASSCNSSTTATDNGLHYCNQPPLSPVTRSESTNPYPTTFVQADTSSFKQVVQMLTGSPRPASHTTSTPPDSVPKSHAHNIPPIKSIPKKNQTSSGFKLYERRNSLKNLKINPIFAPSNSGFSPRKPEILSPSVLDFPALTLSPVTPLIPDPFDRSGPVNNNNNNRDNDVNGNSSIDTVAEEKAIKEKGFFLHPSPASTPQEAEPPRLLPLFPVSSPRVSGSGNPP